jgi:hypothetical protein
MQLAIEDVYEQNLLPGYHFEMIFYDTAGWSPYPSISFSLIAPFSFISVWFGLFFPFQLMCNRQAAPSLN